MPLPNPWAALVLYKFEIMECASLKDLGLNLPVLTIHVLDQSTQFFSVSIGLPASGR